MSITSRISSMEEHVTNAYDELQGLGADLTNVNKNIENISMVLDDIYDSMPQVSGEGTSLTLEDTRVGKIKSTLKGNTSQTGTPTPSSPIPVNVVSGDNEIEVCGKNLLNDNNISGTFVGVDYTFQDGLLTLNGTANAPDGLTGLGTFLREANKSYNINYIYESGTCSDYGAGIFFGNSPNSLANYGGGGGFRASQSRNSVLNVGTTNEYLYMYLNFNKNTTYSNYKIKVQVVEGTTADYNFEPYQGNTYNIDLPVENLFNKDKTKDIFYYNNSGGTTTDGTNKFINQEMPFSNQYTISWGNKIDDNSVTSYVRVVEYNSSDVFVKRTLISTNNTTITMDSNTTKVIMSVDAGPNVYFENLQIEKGSKANSYTPYGTTPIELCKIGNYQDYFYKDSGKWYLHKEIGKGVFDGNGDYGLDGTNANRTAIYSPEISNIENYTDGSDMPNMISNYFTPITLSATWVPGHISRRLNTLRITFLIDPSMTLDDFKTWVSTHNTNVYYALATPTTTEITYQPLIDQLNLLEKAMSKDGQTNISQVNNDLPFIISASALKEWQESSSLNSTLSMVNPLSLGNTLNTQEIENDIQPTEVDNIEPLEEEENEES